MAADGLCDEPCVPLVPWPCSASIAANEFGDKAPLVLLLPDVVDCVVVADVPVAPATALNMLDALL
jgi:hypothetical protein